jgi:transposase
MDQVTTTFVAMDTHKQTISVAIVEGGRSGETRFLGGISSRPDAVAKMVERVAKEHGKLASCYEAGPCGYGLYRQIVALGHECVVVALSLVPTRPGDRVKTDRRDAVTHASLFRSGESTPVRVPDDADEAMRDLCRSQHAAMEALRRARQQVLSFLPRHGRLYSDGKHRTGKHRLWLAGQRFEPAARQIALQEFVQAMEEAQARRDRPAKQMQELLPSWSLTKIVIAIHPAFDFASRNVRSLLPASGGFLAALEGEAPCPTKKLQVILCSSRLMAGSN